MVPNWTVGDRLRKARELAGFSVNSMASELHVARNTIARWEHGRGGVPRTALMSYALVCEVPMGWLETGLVEELDVITDGYRRLIGAAA